MGGGLLQKINRARLRGWIWVLQQVDAHHGVDAGALGYWKHIRSEQGSFAAAGDRASALGMWRGELLPGCFVPQATEFEDWLSAEEAIEYGLVGRIISNKTELKK